MNDLIFAMLSFALVGAITPGPVNLLATSTAIHQGKQAAARYVVGASIAYAMVVFACGFIIQSIVTLQPKLELLMQLASSTFLLYLAYRIYSSAHLSKTTTEHATSALWNGMFMQFLNPKAWLVAISGVSLFVVGQDHESSTLILFTSISLMICLVGVGTWAWMGQRLAKYIDHSSKRCQFNRLMAGLLVISVTMIWI